MTFCPKDRYVSHLNVVSEGVRVRVDNIPRTQSCLVPPFDGSVERSVFRSVHN